MLLVFLCLHHDPPKSFALARGAEYYFLCVTYDGLITLVLTYL